MERTLALRTNAEFRASLQECRHRHEREGGVALEEARERYGLPPSRDDAAWTAREGEQ